jgi:ribulose-phosphate 3-epimerase
MSPLMMDISLWSADLTCLQKEIKRVDQFVDSYHFDVSDAHFSPGLLFFPDLVAALRPLTRRPFHVHLMVENPLDLIVDFEQAGADRITIHSELGARITPAIQKIREMGSQAGLAFCHESNLEMIVPFLDQVDLVLLMGTPVGTRGQELDSQACTRISQMKKILIQNGCADKIKLEADGGIRIHTVPLLYAAGADCIVPGSLVFKSPNLTETFDWLHNLRKNNV